MIDNAKPKTQNTALRGTGLVVFSSKYGSTAEYASLIAEKLNTRALRASEAPSVMVSGADFVVLGSPIYAYSVLPEMEVFLEGNRGALQENHLPPLWCAATPCGTPKRGRGGSGTSQS